MATELRRPASLLNGFFPSTRVPGAWRCRQALDAILCLDLHSPIFVRFERRKCSGTRPFVKYSDNGIEQCDVPGCGNFSASRYTGNAAAESNGCARNRYSVSLSRLPSTSRSSSLARSRLVSSCTGILRSRFSQFFESVRDASLPPVVLGVASFLFRKFLVRSETANNKAVIVRDRAHPRKEYVFGEYVT